MYTVNCSKLCFIEHTCCEFVKRACQTYQHLPVGLPIKPLQAYRDGELTPCNGTIWHPFGMEGPGICGVFFCPRLFANFKDSQRTAADPRHPLSPACEKNSFIKLLVEGLGYFLGYTLVKLTYQWKTDPDWRWFSYWKRGYSSQLCWFTSLAILRLRPFGDGEKGFPEINGCWWPTQRLGT